MKNNSSKFFSDTAKGQHKPTKIKYLNLGYGHQLEKINRTFNMFKNNFDAHIDTSIPLYQENRTTTIKAIQQTFREPMVEILDIGSSSGAYGMTLAYLNNNYDVTVIDPNKDMHENTKQLKFDNFHPLKESWGYYTDSTTIFNQNKYINHFSIIRESMTFQFISPNREWDIQNIVKILKDDGVFISEEKFLTDFTYEINEDLKDIFKNNYYSKKDLKAKSENVLIGMKENQYRYYDYIKLLKQYFKYVELYWISGNFRGLVASNNKSKIITFKENISKFRLYDKKDIETYTTKEYLSTNLLSTPEAIQKAVNKYNHVISQSTYQNLSEANVDNIKYIITYNSEAFAMVSKTWELCHLFKPSWLITRDFIKTTIVDRINLNPEKEYYVNFFNFKGREKLYESLGFITTKIEKFDPMYADQIKEVNKVLYMNYEPARNIRALKYKDYGITKDDLYVGSDHVMNITENLIDINYDKWTLAASDDMYIYWMKNQKINELWKTTYSKSIPQNLEFIDFRDIVEIIMEDLIINHLPENSLYFESIVDYFWELYLGDK